MITVVKGSKGYKKTMEVIRIAKLKDNKHKNVLIITKFDIKDEISLENITVAKSTDDNIADLIANANIILIDEVGSLIEDIELIHLANIGKQVYYTAQTLRADMPFDEVIEIC